MIVRRTFLILGLGALLTGPALGGVGVGVSQIGTVDTQPPTLVVDMSPTGTLFQGGQSIQFTIWTDDDHPGDPDTANLAEVMDADTVLEGRTFTPESEGYVYDWLIPEMSSAKVHLVATSRDSFGNVGTIVSPTFTVFPSVTDVPEASRLLRFGPAHPNPFNPAVNFVIELPEAGLVELVVYDARGRRVRVLLRENRQAGRLDLTWNGTDGNGLRQPGGVYLFEMVFRSGKSVIRYHQKAVLLP